MHTIFFVSLHINIQQYNKYMYILYTWPLWSARKNMTWINVNNYNHSQISDKSYLDVMNASLAFTTFRHVARVCATSVGASPKVVMMLADSAYVKKMSKGNSVTDAKW